MLTEQKQILHKKLKQIKQIQVRSLISACVCVRVFARAV